MKILELLYKANAVAIDLDNLIRAVYWVAMICCGGFAIWKLAEISAAARMIAAGCGG